WLFAFATALDTPIAHLFSPPGGDGAPPIRTEDEIRSMLRRIEGLSESDINATYGVIAMALRSTQGGPQSAADRGQSETSTRRHEPAPSRKRPRQPVS